MRERVSTAVSSAVVLAVLFGGGACKPSAAPPVPDPGSALAAAATATSLAAASPDRTAPPSLPAPAEAPSVPDDAGEMPEDDCILDEAAIRGALDPKGKNVKQVFPEVREDHALEESLELADGTRVTYQFSGCMHISYSFSFDGLPEPESHEASRDLELARSLMRSVPLQGSAEGDREILVGALTRKLEEKDIPYARQFSLPCGDAICTLTTESEAAGKRRVILRYDFAL